MDVNKDAWAILDSREKMALELMTIYGKSSWEAGDIMNIVHFKLLEIHKRAVRFFEIFTYHFEKYGQLIPKEINFLSMDFQEYLDGVIKGRKKVKEVVENMYNWKEWSITEVRNRLIDEQMTRLVESYDTESKELLTLILEFDAWNNFRVLPEKWQEPSAYKRRNKVRDKKHLTNLISIPSVSLEFLWEKYSYDGKYQKAYVPMFSKDYQEGYKVMPIMFSAKKIKAMNEYYLYVFDNLTLAKSFGKTVSEYYLSDRREVKAGQQFWKKFRELKSYAVNFRNMEHINVPRNTVMRRLKQ